MFWIGVATGFVGGLLFVFTLSMAWAAARGEGPEAEQARVDEDFRRMMDQMYGEDA